MPLSNAVVQVHAPATVVQEHDPLLYISLLLLVFTWLVFGGVAICFLIRWRKGMTAAAKDHDALCLQVAQLDAAYTDYTS